MSRNEPRSMAIDEALLRAWPLPMPGADDDKEARGRVCIVAGGRDVPGAALLAGTSALRAGCGKLLGLFANWGTYLAARYVCTDPKAYRHVDRYRDRNPGDGRKPLAEMSEEEREEARAQRRDGIESNKAWASAETTPRVPTTQAS